MAPTIFFCFNILIFIYFLKYKTIETHTLAFLPLYISAVGSVIQLANKILICLVKNKTIGNTNQESTSLVKHAKSHLDTL